MTELKPCPLCKELKEKVALLESRLNKKAVIGQYKFSEHGHEGTVISSSHWRKLVHDAGLSNQWLELVFLKIERPSDLKNDKSVTTYDLNTQGEG